MFPVRATLSVLAAVSACVVLTPGAASAQKRERDRISREELGHPNQRDKDLYTAIRSLRPHFLEGPRANNSMRSVGGAADRNAVRLNVETPKPQVFIDGSRAGDLDVLRGMKTTEVEEVRYLTPSQAGNEYGLGYEGGLILVKRISPKQP